MEDYAVYVASSPSLSNATDVHARRYGYQSNTRVKFVLVLALVDAVVRDMDVKTVCLPFSLLPYFRLTSLQIFRAIHNAYIIYLSNPFANVATENPAALAAPIRSPKFSKAMDRIAGVEEAIKVKGGLLTV